MCFGLNLLKNRSL